MNIKYKRNWSHESIPNRPYDFWFVYNEVPWIIEYDGEQHFEEVDFFHRTDTAFEDKKQIDIIKTFVVCNTGYNVIRIDHLNIKEKDIRFHILEALKLNKTIYYSNDAMYNWLINGSVNSNFLCEECPSLWIKYYNVYISGSQVQIYGNIDFSDTNLTGKSIIALLRLGISLPKANIMSPTCDIISSRINIALPKPDMSLSKTDIPLSKTNISLVKPNSPFPKSNGTFPKSNNLSVKSNASILIPIPIPIPKSKDYGL